MRTKILFLFLTILMSGTCFAADDCTPGTGVDGFTFISGTEIIGGVAIAQYKMALIRHPHDVTEVIDKFGRKGFTEIRFALTGIQTIGGSEGTMAYTAQKYRYCSNIGNVKCQDVCKRDSWFNGGQS